MKRIIAIILLLLLFAGCAGPVETESSSVSPSQSQEGQTEIGSIMKIDVIGNAGIIGLSENGKFFISNLPEVNADECLEWENIVDFATQDYLIAAIDSTGKLYCVNLYKQEDAQIDPEAYTDIVDLAYMQNALVLLHRDGTVSTSGKLSEYYDFSSLADWSGIKMIASSHSHIVGLKKDGTVVACGRNDCGECNTAHFSDIVFIDADDDRTAAVDSFGNAYGIGSGGLYFDGWSNIVSLSLGPFYSLGVTASGRVIKTVYPNDNGTDEYKLNTVTEQTDVVQTCAEYQLCIWLCADGSVGVAGHNANEQTVYDWNLLTGTNKSEQNTPEALAAKRGELKKYEDRILSSDNYTIGFKEDGTMLFSGNYPEAFREIEEWENIVDYAAAADLVYGLTADGHVRYAGSISSGGNIIDLDRVYDWENIIAISTRGDSCCALDKDGNIYTNWYAAYGFYPRQVDGAIDIDATSYNLSILLKDGNVRSFAEALYALPEPNELYASEDENFVQIAGVYNGIFLKEDGNVMGYGMEGIAEAHDTTDPNDWHFVVRLYPVPYGLYGICTDGSVLGYDGMQDYDAAKAVSGWTDIVAVAGGGMHVVGLKADGTVVAYGSNYSGQLNVEGWDLW